MLGGHLSMHAPRKRLLLLAERTSWALGLAGLVWWGAFQLGVARSARHDLARFAALRAASLEQPGIVDQSLWSAERINAWRNLAGEPAPPPVAVLRIPKIGLDVPVLPGTDERTLDRCLGLIEHTADPGTETARGT